MIYFTLIYSVSFFYILEKRDFVFDLISTNDIELLDEDNPTIDNDVETIISQGIYYLYYIFAC